MRLCDFICHLFSYFSLKSRKYAQSFHLFFLMLLDTKNVQISWNLAKQAHFLGEQYFLSDLPMTRNANWFCFFLHISLSDVINSLDVAWNTCFLFFFNPKTLEVFLGALSHKLYLASASIFLAGNICFWFFFNPKFGLRRFFLELLVTDCTDYQMGNC